LSATPPRRLQVEPDGLEVGQDRAVDLRAREARERAVRGRAAELPEAAVALVHAPLLIRGAPRDDARAAAAAAEHPAREPRPLPGRARLGEGEAAVWVEQERRVWADRGRAREQPAARKLAQHLLRLRRGARSDGQRGGHVLPVARD
jgi:hypothetical protein